jgi:hypothetical protein
MAKGGASKTIIYKTLQRVKKIEKHEQKIVCISGITFIVYAHCLMSGKQNNLNAIGSK